MFQERLNFVKGGGVLDRKKTVAYCQFRLNELVAPWDSIGSIALDAAGNFCDTQKGKKTAFLGSKRFGETLRGQREDLNAWAHPEGYSLIDHLRPGAMQDEESSLLPVLGIGVGVVITIFDWPVLAVGGLLAAAASG